MSFGITEVKVFKRNEKYYDTMQEALDADASDMDDFIWCMLYTVNQQELEATISVDDSTSMYMYNYIMANHEHLIHLLQKETEKD